MKKSIYLFSDKHPTGLMMNLTEAEIAEKLDSGEWQDTPKRRQLPEGEDTGITIEQAESANPQQIKELLESYGFIVMTKEQLQAEANKMAALALDITKFDDEAIIEEAERRGIKQKDYSELEAIFENDPAALTKEQLLEYGNSVYDLGLRMNYSEATMIERISAAQEAEQE